MKRVMIDIESLGLQPGGLILSIGACEFSLHGGASLVMEWRPDLGEQLVAGARVDGPSIEWWFRQSVKPWREETRVKPCETVARELHALFTGDADEVWANPPSYDLAAVEHFARRHAPIRMWNRRAEQSYRTLRRIWRCANPMRQTPEQNASEKHGAADDAVWQAERAAEMLRDLGARE